MKVSPTHFQKKDETGTWELSDKGLKLVFSV